MRTSKNSFLFVCYSRHQKLFSRGPNFKNNSLTLTAKNRNIYPWSANNIEPPAVLDDETLGTLELPNGSLVLLTTFYGQHLTMSRVRMYT